MKIKTLKELTQKNNIQYKQQNLTFDYIDTKNEKDLEKAEIFQIWSYNTIIGYFNKTTNKIVFTSRKYSRTTTKQTNNIIFENGLEIQTTNKIFSNWFTFSDLQELKTFLI